MNRREARPRLLPATLAFLTAFALAGTAAAQAATEPAAKAANGPAAEAHKKPLVIGMPVTPPNLPHIGVYIAKDLGYFEEEGIAVDLKGFESGLQSLRGGVAGGLDILGASSEPVIKAISRGAKFRSIFSYAHKLTVVMVAQEGIRRPADLRGKNLGIQDVAAFREVMTRAVLHSAGLTPNDAQYVPVSSAGYVSGLISGKIDTAILHIDQAYMAQSKKPSLHVLVPLWEVMPTYWYGTFTTSEELLRKDPALIAGAVAAIVKAHRFMYRNKDRTLELASKHTGYPKEVLGPAYDVLAAAKVWPVNDGMPAAMVRVTVDKLVEIGMLKESEKPKVEQVVDREPANTALARLGRWTDDPAWK